MKKYKITSKKMQFDVYLKFKKTKKKKANFCKLIITFDYEKIKSVQIRLSLLLLIDIE